jgi:hypothetical protein
MCYFKQGRRRSVNATMSFSEVIVRDSGAYKSFHGLIDLPKDDR